MRWLQAAARRAKLCIAGVVAMINAYLGVTAAAAQECTASLALQQCLLVSYAASSRSFGKNEL